MKTVAPGDAADQIVNAVRRNYFEITIPSDMYYQNKVSALSITFYRIIYLCLRLYMPLTNILHPSPKSELV